MVDEITIGIYSGEGGTEGEFAVRWSELGQNVVPLLVAWDDAWGVLHEFRDVLSAMRSVADRNISPADMCKLLESCGVEDATPTENPHGKPQFSRLYEKPAKHA